jgi:hypothetical protein
MKKLFGIFTISFCFALINVQFSLNATIPPVDPDEEEMWEEIFEELFDEEEKEKKAPKYSDKSETPSQKASPDVIKIPETKLLKLNRELDDFSQVLGDLVRALTEEELEESTIATIKPHSSAIKNIQTNIGEIQSLQPFLLVLLKPELEKTREKIKAATTKFSSLHERLLKHIEKVKTFKEEKQLTEEDVLLQLRLPQKQRKTMTLPPSIISQERFLKSQIANSLNLYIKPVEQQLVKVVTDPEAKKKITTEKKQQDDAEKATTEKMKRHDYMGVGRQPKYMEQPYGGYPGRTRYESGESYWGGEKDDYNSDHYAEERDYVPAEAETTQPETSSTSGEEKPTSVGGLGRLLDREKDIEKEKDSRLSGDIESLMRQANFLASSLISKEDKTTHPIQKSDLIVELNSVTSALAKRKDEWLKLDKKSKQTKAQKTQLSKTASPEDNLINKQEHARGLMSTITKQEFVDTLLEVCKFVYYVPPRNKNGEPQEQTIPGIQETQKAALNVFNTIKNSWPDFIKKPFGKLAQNRLNSIEETIKQEINKLKKTMLDVKISTDGNLSESSKYLELETLNSNELESVNTHFTRLIKLTGMMRKDPKTSNALPKEITQPNVYEFVQNAELLANSKYSSVFDQALVEYAPADATQKNYLNKLVRIINELYNLINTSERFRKELHIQKSRKIPTGPIKIIDAVYGNINPEPISNPATGNIKNISQIDTVKFLVEEEINRGSINQEAKTAECTIQFMEEYLRDEEYGPAPRKLFVHYKVGKEEFQNIFTANEDGSITMQLSWAEEQTKEVVRSEEPEPALEPTSETEIADETEVADEIPSIETLEEPEESPEGSTTEKVLKGIGAAAGIGATAVGAKKVWDWGKKKWGKKTTEEAEPEEDDDSDGGNGDKKTASTQTEEKEE